MCKWNCGLIRSPKKVMFVRKSKIQKRCKKWNVFFSLGKSRIFLSFKVIFRFPKFPVVSANFLGPSAPLFLGPSAPPRFTQSSSIFETWPLIEGNPKENEYRKKLCKN